jgi:hypothetical protein
MLPTPNQTSLGLRAVLIENASGNSELFSRLTLACLLASEKLVI